MNATEFIARLQNLYAQRGTPEYDSLLKALRQDLWSIQLNEEPPYPPEDYPDWLKFTETYAQALKGSHLHAHYFEFHPTALQKIGQVYERLTDFVRRQKPDGSMLEHFIRQEKESGRVKKSQPVEIPAWRAAKSPGQIPHYLQLIIPLDEPHASRRVVASFDDVVLLKRHGGKQIQFAVSPDKTYDPELHSHMMLAFWVYVSEEDSSQREVHFGTGYIGENFPFAGGDIMGWILDPKRKHKLQQQEIQSFLERHQDGTMHALLSPKALHVGKPD